MTSRYGEPPPQRSTIEAIIRFLVWSVVIGCVGLPILLTAMVYFQIFTAFPVGRGSDAFHRTVDPLFGQGGSPPSEPNITTNVLDKERARQIERLAALTGRPEMASGAASAVQFIAVKFEGIKPDAAEAIALPRQRVYEDGYRRLTLNMASVPREAVVLVSEQPIRWSITGLQPRSLPRVGFEGYAAFDVADGQPGSLAGFRIGAFGASGMMRTADPTKGEVSVRQTFCKSVQNWTDHFGLPFNSVQFTLILNPTTITPRSGVPLSDGEIARSMFSQDIVRLCRPNNSSR